MDKKKEKFCRLAGLDRCFFYTNDQPRYFFSLSKTIKESTCYG